MEFETEVKEIVRKINNLTLHYIMGTDEIKLKTDAVNSLMKLIEMVAE